MNDVIQVAWISFAGTVLGSLIGVLAANKLSNYRIEQLEKKVDKHNNVVERMYALETKVGTIEHVVDNLVINKGD